MQIYTVKQGDTIDRIAGAAGMDPLRLAHDNQIEPPYRLAVGQSLLVAGGDSEEAGGRLGGFRIGNVQTGLCGEKDRRHALFFQTKSLRQCRVVSARI